MPVTKEEEDRIRRDEASKWLEAIDRHASRCPSTETGPAEKASVGMGGECKKYIAAERLQMRLDEDPNLPPGQWWP